MKYDPVAGPDPNAWLGLDEGERVEQVLRHHKRLGARAGNLRVHAIIHVTVETQLAEGHEAAVGALQRLLRDGLDRHDAIHAIGTAVADQIYSALKGTPFGEEAYERSLKALNADKWRRSSGRE